MVADKEIANWRAEQLDALKGLVRAIEALPSWVQFHALGQLQPMISPVVELLELAESPIEQLLGIYLVQLPEFIWNRYKTLYCELIPQQEVSAAGKTYRADFLISIEQPPEPNRLLIAVECDGHDFHERTKEQARRDRSRDRSFQTAGIHVLRFTGSEIWKNPGWCAHEVSEFIDALISKHFVANPE